MPSSSWQHFVPKKILSKIFGYLARSQTPFIKNFLIAWFTKTYQIDMHEAVESNPRNFKNLESFFIREVKKELRPFSSSVTEIASPVDGKISQIGIIDRNHKGIQAKGVNFGLETLLGDMSTAQQFTAGSFATIYLAPYNFHRVYMPIDGILKKVIYIPGELFAVNAASAQTIPNLYGKNERLIMLCETKAGQMAIIFVGAMIVAGIYTNLTKEETIGGKIKTKQEWNYQNENIILTKGQELGYFTFGSTVILLFQESKVTFDQANTTVDKPVLIGQSMGRVISTDHHHQ